MGPVRASGEPRDAVRGRRLGPVDPAGGAVVEREPHGRPVREPAGGRGRRLVLTPSQRIALQKGSWRDGCIGSWSGWDVVDAQPPDVLVLLLTRATDFPDRKTRNKLIGRGRSSQRSVLMHEAGETTWNSFLHDVVAEGIARGSYAFLWGAADMWMFTSALHRYAPTLSGPMLSMKSTACRIAPPDRDRNDKAGCYSPTQNGPDGSGSLAPRGGPSIRFAVSTQTWPSMTRTPSRSSPRGAGPSTYLPSPSNMAPCARSSNHPEEAQ